MTARSHTKAKRRARRKAQQRKAEALAALHSRSHTTGIPPEPLAVREWVAFHHQKHNPEGNTTP